MEQQRGALVEEAASRAEQDNRLEAAALHEGDIVAVRGAWASIVGTDVAPHSRPVGIANGALIVVTCSNAWSQHLGFMAERIVAGVNEAIGRPDVDRVRLRGPAINSLCAPRTWRPDVDRVRLRVRPLHLLQPQIEMAKPGTAPALRGPKLKGGL